MIFMGENSITRKMYLKEILSMHPKSAETMMKFGLHCLGCPVSGMETLEDGARSHGMDEEELEMLLDELNGRPQRARDVQTTISDAVRNPAKGRLR